MSKTFAILLCRIVLLALLHIKTQSQQLQPSNVIVGLIGQDSSTTLSVNGTLRLTSIGNSLPLNSSNSSPSTTTQTASAANSATTAITTKSTDVKASQSIMTAFSTENLTGAATATNASQVIQLRMGLLVANGTYIIYFYLNFYNIRQMFNFPLLIFKFKFF